LRVCWEFLLVGSSGLSRGAPGARVHARSALDLAALVAQPLGRHVAEWPRRVLSPDHARRLLGLLRRDAAGLMPVPLTPSCELALPSARPDAYHVAHVLLDGAFLRFYPEGISPGVAYPVEDVPALHRLIGAPDREVGC